MDRKTLRVFKTLIKRACPRFSTPKEHSLFLYTSFSPFLHPFYIYYEYYCLLLFYFIFFVFLLFFIFLYITFASSYLPSLLNNVAAYTKSIRETRLQEIAWKTYTYNIHMHIYAKQVHRLTNIYTRARNNFSAN